MKEFTRARIKLFGWYVLINLLLLGAFTAVAFQAEKQSFAQIDQMLQNRIQRPVISIVLEQRLSEFSGSFRERLLYSDLILFLAATAASWFLSGVTLKPIEKMIEKQQEFSADASHELRTPITTIMMELESIKRNKSKLPAEIGNSLKVIMDEANRMKRLITNLLNLVRNNNTSQTNFIRFELGEEVESVATLMRNQASEKQLKLLLYKGPLVWVFGDKEAIREAITILVDNAIKFTQQGNIKITTAKKGKFATVEIADTGIGISESDLSRIFDRFYRIHNRANTQGTGLGLSIAQKIIHEHGGKINVQSQLDHGSTFIVTLPAES